MGEIVEVTQRTPEEREAMLRAAASILVERYQFMRQAGISFDGERDLYAVLGYDRTITDKQYRDRYARGGIAKRIVEALPKATWRGGAELIEDENPDVSTDFEKAWETLATKLKVWSVFRRADILSGLSTFSVILIGAPGELDSELPKASGPDQLLYLSPFSGGGSLGNKTATVDADCRIQEYENDINNPRFGLPKFYQLRRTNFTSPGLQRQVHWTRVLHIAEDCLFDEVFGAPALENVWNLLDDLDKVTGGGAEAFWLRANQGLNLNLDKDAALSPEAAAKLADEVDEYRHNISRILKTRGMDVKALGSDVANFSNPADAILTQIAGSKGIPKRILTGSEMGELASSQDRDNWRDQINGRQTEHAGPYIVRPLVDRLIQYGYLPTPTQYEVRWPHIQVLTEAEKADGATKWATVNATTGRTVFTDEEIRDKWYSMAPLTDEQRAEMAANAPASAAPMLAAAAEHDELLRVLESAVENNNTDVIDALLGTDHFHGQ